MGQLNGTHEKQDRYSSLVLAKLRSTSVMMGLFNIKYEGSPVAGAVKIPVRDDEVKVNKDYDIKSGGELTTSKTTYKTLPIDKSLYVNELIDGYEADAVPDNLTADRLDSAGYAMGLEVDSELINVCATSGTASTNTTALTAKTVYTSIVDEVQALKKKGVHLNEMWLVVTNETFGLLCKAPEFINASDSGVKNAVEGFRGTVFGLKVYETNNIPDDSNIEYILGNNVFCHFVNDWMKKVSVNAIADGKHIGASALQGRQVYGDMISRPETVTIKKKAAA